MEDGSLSEALDAARRGEEWALAALFRSWQPLLLRYLRRQAASAAEDLASETWLAASRRLPSFEGSVSDFRALLFTIARRRVVDHYRAVGRRPLADSVDDIGERAVAYDDPADAVVAELSAQEAIGRLLGRLPAAQAEVILLRIVADLSVEEVARVIGRSRGAVRVLQHRGLQRLAREFDRRT